MGLLKLGVAGGAFLPFLTFAQSSAGCNTGQMNVFERLLCNVSVIVNTIIPILIALGVVYFIWGVINYAIAKDEEAKTAGRGAMISGLIALMVIVSIWGLVNMLKSFIGVGNDNTIAVPCVATPGNGCPNTP